MKKILIYIVSVVFLLTSASFAIDKTGSKKSVQKTSDKPTDIENKPIEKPSGQPTEAGKHKDFNDFVDKNNNGIDDRAEKTRIKSTPPEKEKKEEKPQPKPDSTSKTKGK